MVDGQRTYDVLMELLDPKLVKFQFQMSTISQGFVAARVLHEVPGPFLLDARAGRGPERATAAGAARRGVQYRSERQHRLGQDVRGGENRRREELLRRAEHGAHEGKRRRAEGDDRPGMATLGVAVCGAGWCASQHIAAFQHNPRTAVTWICGRDLERTRAAAAKAGIALAGVRITTNYEEVLAARGRRHRLDRHAEPSARRPGCGRRGSGQALRARKADRPRRAGTRPHSRRRAGRRRADDRVVRAPLQPVPEFARWLRTEGWLGEIRFARTQYLSRVTDWYSGWDWVRTRESGRSHLLAAGCHAVDALRWCSGLEPIAVSAFHTRLHRAATSGRPRSSRT